MGEFQKYVDQLGFEVLIPTQPKRIVSLVPSQTELLAYFGLESQVIGITKFCIHPAEWQKKKCIVGGTKKFDFKTIESLNPDLIIGNKEENYQEGIEVLKKIAPVWMSNITSVDDATQMIGELGKITNRVEISKQLTNSIHTSLNSIIRGEPKRVLYLIWYNPWMAAGEETFIHAMLNQVGFRNCLNIPRYPKLDHEEIKNLNPEIILLSSEPFPFKQKHLDELQQILPSTKIIFVDGEMFSWYGNRLIYFDDYFNSAIRPLIH